jgi:beta-phosphoglucomutase-like phosphatase (HAD superfamily)
MAQRCGDAGAARHLTVLLALFDLDGTLFLTHDPISGRALVATLQQVYDVDVPAEAPANVEHRGLTAKRIARNVLRAVGLTDEASTSGWIHGAGASATDTSSLSPKPIRAVGGRARAQPRVWLACGPPASASRSSPVTPNRSPEPD